MNTLLRLASSVGAGLLVLSSATAREKWLHARTDHFEMFSCASEGQSREVLAKLEQFRATVLKFLPLRNNREPPTTVVLFDSDRRFEPYRPLRDGRPEEAGGYCLHTPDETMIVLATERDSEKTGEIIFHEYVHLLLAARGDNPPTWLNEGLADFFSTFVIKRDRYEIGHHKPGRVEVLRFESLMPLGRLFAVTQNSSEYHEGSARDVFYAESWLLVHYAICGEDQKTLLPALLRFPKLLSAPDAVVGACFREAFGMSYEEMERRLQTYARGGSYRWTYGPLVLGDLSSRIKFQPADDFERDLALIDLRWRLQQPGSTTYQLMQLAQQRPDSPRPYEVLAAVAMRDGDFGGALKRWQRAAELRSENAYVYLQLARDRLNQLMSGFPLDYRLPVESAATLRGWLDRAVSLSPNYLEACEALLLVEAMAEQPRIALIKGIVPVVPQMRDRSRSLFALAVIQWRAGDEASARTLDDLLLKSPQTPPQIRALAKRLDQRLPPAAAVPAPPPAKDPGQPAVPAGSTTP